MMKQILYYSNAESRRMVEADYRMNMDAIRAEMERIEVLKPSLISPAQKLCLSNGHYPVILQIRMNDFYWIP